MTLTMRDPLFSYNLSRAYPVRWFTPVVIVGGIIITVLVSVLSVATSGYQLVSEPSSNPNITEAGKSWFGRGLGSILGSMQPSCASTTIPLNTVLYTNNTALAYTLEGITLTRPEGKSLSQGSLVYHNNLLQNCSITSIEIDFESLQRSAFAFAVQQQGADLTGYVQCYVAAPQGMITVSLATKWSEINDGPAEATFIDRDPVDQASLYWANSLLSMYWIQLTNAMYENNNLYADNDPESYGFFKGYVNLTRSHPELAASVADIESLDFFDAQCWFMPFNGTGRVTNMAFCADAPLPISSLSNGTVSDYSHTSPLPMIWIPTDSLAKAFYFAIMTDLGQSLTTNLLTNVDLLKHFTSNFTAIHATFGTVPGMNAAIGDHEGTANTPFTDANATSARLTMSNSTLATNYLCQVPQLKPTGSLIVAVLVADLVLLQTIWKIFKLVVDQILLSRHPDMRYCEGCLRSMHLGEKAVIEETEAAPGAVPLDTPGKGQYAAVDQDNIELDNLLHGQSAAQGQRPASMI